MNDTHVVYNERNSEAVVVNGKEELNDAVQNLVDDGVDANDITIYSAKIARCQIVTKVEVEFY